MSNRWPAVVREVDRERREVRVEVPGITDGADRFPIAEIEYPIGDRSEQTEIRILPGDRVWVSFIGGDTRYPIITGFRAKHVGNEVGTRRWVHDNFETIADVLYRVQAGEKLILDVGGTLVTITPGLVQIDSADTVVNGKTTFNGDCALNGDLTHNGSQTVTGTVAAQGGVSTPASVSAGAATIGGISFGSHRHTGVQGGSSTSGGPT